MFNHCKQLYRPACTTLESKVYLGSASGDVRIFAHGKQERLLGNIDMKSSIKGTPVAANGVLYIRTDRHLYAISSR